MLNQTQYQNLTGRAKRRLLSKLSKNSYCYMCLRCGNTYDKDLAPMALKQTSIDREVSLITGMDIGKPMPYCPYCKKGLVRVNTSRIMEEQKKKLLDSCKAKM